MIKVKTENNNKLNNLGFWFCAVYFFSYLTRQNYSAVLTEIISDLGVTKSLAGVAITGSLISYGVFQIISGIIGDRYKPEKIIFTGLSGSAFINILVCLFPNVYAMNVLWCINGVFQSLIWPPLVRMIIETLGSEKYSLAVVRVTQSSYAATIAAYLVVPALISFFSWRVVFLIFGSVSLVFSIFWNFKTKNVSEIIKEKKSVSSQNENEKNALSKKLLIQLGIIPIILSTFIAGFLRDGISTWMPTYIKEVYDASTVTSILTGAIIPLSCALCLELLNIIGKKMNNEVKTAALFYFVGMCGVLTLAIAFSKYPAFDVFLMSVVTVSVHGVNLMLLCNVPKRFSKFNKTSTLSGLLNSAVYAGAALSTFGTGYVATNFDWKIVVAIWAFVVGVAFLLCFFTNKKYKSVIQKTSI